MPKIEFYREVSLGNMKIEISIHESQGYKVYFTAKDNDDRRIWRTALTDSEGNLKTYQSLSDAISDAEHTIETSSEKLALSLSDNVGL